MANRIWLLGVVLASLCAPAGALGQSADHDDIEVIEPPKGGVPRRKADLSKARDRIVALTNSFRKAEGRGLVTVNKALADAADGFARYMAANDRYGHTADGRRPADRASKSGYEYYIVLENIAYQYSSLDFATEALAEGFERGWERSPGHRRNMLDPDVTHTGVAVARSDKTGHYYAVQMFGRPKSLAIEFAIENRTGEEVAYTIAGQTFRLGPRYTRKHTRCRPAAVTFAPASGEGEGGGEGKKLTPTNGDRYTVTPDGNGYDVKKE